MQEQQPPNQYAPAPVENPRVKSMKSFFKRLARNKPAMVGAFLIVFLMIVALIGAYFTTLEPNAQDYSVKLEGPLLTIG